MYNYIYLIFGSIKVIFDTKIYLTIRILLCHAISNIIFFKQIGIKHNLIFLINYVFSIIIYNNMPLICKFLNSLFNKYNLFANDERFNYNKEEYVLRNDLF